MGIDVRDPDQPSARCRAASANAWRSRARVYFGAKVLILDEPTSALGVHQASMVLRFIAQAKSGGVGVIFITHNVHHAYPVGDVFTLLNRGRSLGTFRKGEISHEDVLSAMAGGEALSL